MRTLCLGNLPPTTTLSEVLDQIRGGILEHARHHPELSCCFLTFLDPLVPTTLLSLHAQRPLHISLTPLTLSYGKPSAIPPLITHAVMNGATRNVFIGNIDHEVTEQFLHAQLSRFGLVDHIKILYEKRIAFVHMSGIAQAMRAVATLQLEPAWMLRRVHYGRDRCAPSGLNPLQSLPQGLIGAHLRKLGDPSCLLAPLNSPGNIPNRTIYVGGIHPDVTTKDICDTIRGGILQHIKYMAEKNIAFVTFVDAECANLFYDRTQLEGLVFKGKRVGWGKATPLPTSVQLAVSQSLASRNVYIGSIDDQISESRLLRDFGDFGDIELVNIIPDKNIAFVNFTDILSAIRAVEVMKNAQEYQRFKINYGKDRCGNSPRAPRLGLPNTLHYPPQPTITYNAYPQDYYHPTDIYPSSSPHTLHRAFSMNEIGYQKELDMSTTPFFEKLLDGNQQGWEQDSLSYDALDVQDSEVPEDAPPTPDLLNTLFSKFSFDKQFRSQTSSPLCVDTTALYGDEQGYGASAGQGAGERVERGKSVKSPLGSGVFLNGFGGIGSGRRGIERQYSSPSPW